VLIWLMGSTYLGLNSDRQSMIRRSFTRNHGMGMIFALFARSVGLSIQFA
jgi:hypothetical protein